MKRTITLSLLALLVLAFGGNYFIANGAASVVPCATPILLTPVYLPVIRGGNDARVDGLLLRPTDRPERAFVEYPKEFNLHPE